MRQNPWNGIMLAGHAQGTITMWAPNMAQPTVKMLCHRGTVRAIAVERNGHTLVTAGLDSFVCVWDLRNTYKQLLSYRTQQVRPSLLV